MDCTWRFVETFEPTRRQTLEGFDTFEKVADLLCADKTIQSAWMRDADRLGIENCWRPIVRLLVKGDTFDAFFNSPAGYRGQYLRSPDTGQAANNRLLQRLEPELSAAIVAAGGTSKLPAAWIRNAFLANSAKIWVDEDALDWLDVCRDLDIDRWYQNRDKVNAPSGSGLWAPQGTLLKVMGAFIDSSGNEVVSRHKIGRRFDIHECGFS